MFSLTSCFTIIFKLTWQKPLRSFTRRFSAQQAHLATVTAHLLQLPKYLSPWHKKSSDWDRPACLWHSVLLGRSCTNLQKCSSKPSHLSLHTRQAAPAPNSCPRVIWKQSTWGWLEVQSQFCSHCSATESRCRTSFGQGMSNLMRPLFALGEFTNYLTSCSGAADNGPSIKVGSQGMSTLCTENGQTRLKYYWQYNFKFRGI